MPALEGRKIFVVGIGGAGMSAYALLAQAWGAEVAGLGPQRHPVCRARARRRHPGDDLGGARSPRGMGGLRLERVRLSGPQPRRAAGRARLPAAVDRGVGNARQDDDGGDDRLLPPAARPRSGVPDRRRDPSARRKRRGGGGVARRRGRRVRSHGRAPSSRDRGRHERGARPSHDVRLAGRARGDVRGLAGSRAERGARLGARAGDDGAARPGRAQPPERRVRPRRARARRHRSWRSGGRLGRVPRRRPALRARGRAARDRRVRRLRPPSE